MWFLFCLSTFYVLYVQCCRFLRIIHSWLPPRLILTFFKHHWQGKFYIWLFNSETPCVTLLVPIKSPITLYYILIDIIVLLNWYFDINPVLCPSTVVLSRRQLYETQYDCTESSNVKVTEICDTSRSTFALVKIL